MYKSIIMDSSESELKDYICEIMSMVKDADCKLYNVIELYLYKNKYGNHFNEWLLKKATESFENEDGTNGAHWTVDQTNSVAEQNNITFDKFNSYDWNYVMNMIYSDYYGVINNDTNVYCNMALKFLLDKDAPEGKAFIYYLAMNK